MTESFPLIWPEGWPRTPENKRGSNSNLRTVTFDAARKTIFDELRMLKAQSPVLSTNVPIRQDGMPYADAARRRMQDPGVAVYFSLRNRPMSMARDAYYDIAQNLRSLALAINYMRGLERHGGSQMVERAFSGFAQLPPPGSMGGTPDVDWREELGPFPDELADYEILVLAEGRYRHKAKNMHSDRGGNDLGMIRLNLAIAQARKELGA